MNAVKLDETEFRDQSHSHKRLFEYLCSHCHTLDADCSKHKFGPNLRGLENRKVASAEGFKYSNAIQSKNFIWNEYTLTKYLLNPTDVTPLKNGMLRPMRNKKQIDDLIEFIFDHK